MNEKLSAPAQNFVSTINVPRWPAYLLVTMISVASAVLSLLMAVLSVNTVVVYLSLLTSVVCFASALGLVFYRRVVFALLLSLSSAPIFLSLTILYFETHAVRIEAIQKVSDIGHFIVAKIKDPQPALDKAIREGYIRKATAVDVRAFRDAYIEKKYISKNLLVPVEENALSVTKVDLSRAYVVLKKFTFPSGLVDEYRGVFFIPAGVPEPSGEIGESAFYDFGTLTVGCTAARTGGVSC